MKTLYLLLCFCLFNSLSAQWTQIGNDIDGEATGDNSGFSVSMPDRFTIGIGATTNSGNGSNSGHVRIFRWSGSAWLQKGSDIDGEFMGDHSGSGLSMPDSNTIAIGAEFNDGGGASAGHVRIYKWSGNTWIQKGSDIDGDTLYDYSGRSVSMPDSNTIAIGASDNDDNGNNAGQVKIYEWTGNSWIQKGKDIDGDAIWDRSGWSVSMPDANTIAIGARNNSDGGFEAGQVRIFHWNGSSWIQKGLDIDGEAAGDHSGTSVSMPDSNTVAIGAPFNDGNQSDAGQVRIYQWNGSSWGQKGLDIDGENASDRSGWSVKMPDSNTVAIGAPHNNGNGTKAGHVRIYKWSGSSWTQNGFDIDGDTANDYSGVSVSMPDIHTLAIGANGNDGNGANSGHVRVFNYAISTAITESQLNRDLSIYPNPAKAELKIESTNAIGERVQILNLIGTVVKEFQLSSNLQVVDLTELNNGIYFIKFKSQTQKLIISK